MSVITERDWTFPQSAPKTFVLLDSPAAIVALAGANGAALKYNNKKRSTLSATIYRIIKIYIYDRFYEQGPLSVTAAWSGLQGETVNTLLLLKQNLWLISLRKKGKRLFIVSKLEKIYKNTSHCWQWSSEEFKYEYINVNTFVYLWLSSSVHVVASTHPCRQAVNARMHCPPIKYEQVCSASSQLSTSVPSHRRLWR